MSERQLVTTQHNRHCERCGHHRVIHTHPDSRPPAFTEWIALDTGALFGRFETLGRGPYDLCPQCAASFIEWWKG
jgi:ribosomal protein S27AE